MILELTTLVTESYPHGYDPSAPLQYENPNGMLNAIQSLTMLLTVIFSLATMVLPIFHKGSRNITLVIPAAIAITTGLISWSISQSISTHAEDFPDDKDACDHGIQWAQERYGVTVQREDCWLMFAHHPLRGSPDRLAYDTQRQEYIEALDVNSGIIFIDPQTREELPIQHP